MRNTRAVSHQRPDSETHRTLCALPSRFTCTIIMEQKLQADSVLSSSPHSFSSAESAPMWTIHVGSGGNHSQESRIGPGSAPHGIHVKMRKTFKRDGLYSHLLNSLQICQIVHNQVSPSIDLNFFWLLGVPHSAFVFPSQYSILE